MKNPKMAREYNGYYFTFEDIEIRDRFLNLYWDLFKDYEIDPFHKNEPLFVKVLCKGGIIPEIRKNLGDLITTQRYRYFVKAV